MLIRHVSLTVVLLLGACRADAPTAPQASPTASAAAVSPSAEPSPSASTSKLLVALRGRWLVELTPKQEQDLATLRLVFEAKEPSPEQLARLSPQERGTIMAVRAARLAKPTDPQYVEMQAVLEGMARTSLEVYTSSMTLVVGTVVQSADLEVLTETATSVRLAATTRAGKREELELGVLGDERVRLYKPAQRDALTFKRSAR